MKLRGHHIFCTALFVGKGYNEAFAEKMDSVIHRWKQGEAAEIVQGQDEICFACPNRLSDGGCLLGTEDVHRRDEKATAVLGLSVSKLLSWEQAGKRLSRLTEEEFQEVCGECRWQREGLCSLSLLLQAVEAGQKKPLSFPERIGTL